MAALGPFEPTPRLAAGVSGGPDSMALALLADEWVRERGGSLIALIVDHGLRAEAAGEAAHAAGQLQGRGIATRILGVSGLARGPALAERARAARIAALQAACQAAGILHLLLGHHAGDQAETVLIRSLGGSGAAGLAGMAPLVETSRLRILRPLLAVAPGCLRATVQAVGLAWVDDPSNVDPSAQRPRLRLLRRDRRGEGPATTALAAAAAAAGQQRAARDGQIATCLAAQVALHPEGFAVWSGQPILPAALAALLQMVGGSEFPPPTDAVLRLAAAPGPGTLAGVRVLPAGRLGSGFLVVREVAAMARPVSARPGTVWDGRFRLGADAVLPDNATIGALGQDAVRLRRHSSLPAAVLHALPAIRAGETLCAVPHLRYPVGKDLGGFPVLFSPPRPAAAAPFGIGDA